MPKSPLNSESEKVIAHIRKLESPLREVVEALRKFFLKTDKEIGEQIKWNSPSFFYTGDMKPFNPKEYKRDIAVMNLHKGFVMLVFPTGAKVKDNSGFLEGNYPDGRKIVKIQDMKDLVRKEETLRKVIQDWLKQVEK